MKISGGVVAHSQTTGRTVDDHHTEAHAQNSAAHTGAITLTQHGSLGAIVAAHGHDDLDTIGANDHNHLEGKSVAFTAGAAGSVTWDSVYGVTPMVVCSGSTGAQTGYFVSVRSTTGATIDTWDTPSGTYYAIATEAT